MTTRKTAIIFSIAALASIIGGVVAMEVLPKPNMAVDFAIPTMAEPENLSVNGHVFQVEVVTSREAIQRGLMHRRHLPTNRGMLFDFGLPERPVSFWMKNTYIPLDILFLDKTGRIVHIARNTTPLSETTIPSTAPIRGVLEINAGIAQERNIDVGDQVKHKIFNEF